MIRPDMIAELAHELETAVYPALTVRLIKDRELYPGIKKLESESVSPEEPWKTAETDRFVDLALPIARKVIEVSAGASPARHILDILSEDTEPTVCPAVRRISFHPNQPIDTPRGKRPVRVDYLKIFDNMDYESKENPWIVASNIGGTVLQLHGSYVPKHDTPPILAARLADVTKELRRRAVPETLHQIWTPDSNASNTYYTDLD